LDLLFVLFYFDQRRAYCCVSARSNFIANPFHLSLRISMYKIAAVLVRNIQKYRQSEQYAPKQGMGECLTRLVFKQVMLNETGI